MRNVWEAGQDALLKALAERDARQRLEEDRARQAQLDEERRQQIQHQYEMQQAQLKSLDEDREERRKLAAEGAEFKGNQLLLQDEQKRKIDAAKRDAVNKFQSATTDQEREAARMELRMLGISVPNPPAPQRPMTVAPGATVYDPTTGKAKFTAPNRPTTPKAQSSLRSERELPQGVTDWIETLTQYPRIEQANEALMKNWDQQKAVHPDADLGKAKLALARLFPNGNSLNEEAGKQLAAAAVARQSGAAPAAAATQNTVPDTAPKANAPKVGERRMFGTQVGQWDGKNWVAVK